MYSNFPFSAFTNHRRAVSNFQNTDAMSPMLPQLTSPLSPPAFNPHEILLGSNEAIAGLDSPAPIPSTSVSAGNAPTSSSTGNTSSSDLTGNAPTSNFTGNVPTSGSNAKLPENAFNWLDSKMNSKAISHNVYKKYTCKKGNVCSMKTIAVKTPL